MVRINLLPLRQSRKLQAARQELQLAASLLGLLLFALYLWHGATQSHISQYQSRLSLSQTSVSDLDKKVEQIKSFKEQAAALEQKLSSVETLRRQRTGPAKMMANLSDIFTRLPRVWLTRFEEIDGVLTLDGGAVDQEQISALQLALSKDSVYFSGVTLGVVDTMHEEGADFLQWTMTCTLHYEAS